MAELFSETAIYDPELTLTLPKKITIQTGLDVLSHSLESIWNKNASSITIAHAVTASKIVINNLFVLCINLESIELREEMMRASIHAGLSFSNTQTAIAHAMSYYITNYHGVPHGIACSFTLPMIIDQIIGKYKYIDCALEEIFGELSSKPIRNLFRSLEISTNMIDYGIDDDEFKKLVSSINNEQRTSNSLVKI